MSKFIVRKVAVLGAGVMGAQIAAHCANANVPVILFDLPAEGDKPDAIVEKARAGLARIEPAPLGSRRRLNVIEAANYGSDLARLRECDLVIEAIAERIDWKLDLYREVAPFLRPEVVFATNTSGLAIHRLAEGMPPALRSRFLGVHFFNPPRYMPLVELIAAPQTDPALLDGLEAWLTTRLGKRIVRARDTPNFIANRIGVFSLIAVMHHTRRLGLGFDEADALTGPVIGRAKSATFRTADVVGLDVLSHVVGTMHEMLPDDPWHGYFSNPDWMQALIAGGALGQKRGAGVYRKDGRKILVLDPATGDYRSSAGEVAPEVADILKASEPAARFADLRESAHPHADLLWSIHRDVFHYCAVHLSDIADSARDIDLAMRWGFGWSQGPFETWQAAGWEAVANAIKADIDAGVAMAAEPLPSWVFGRDSVHCESGSFNAAAYSIEQRRELPVYKRQLYPERLFGEAPSERGKTLWENAGVRLWSRPDRDARIGILSFRSKAHSIGSEVLDGIVEAVARAERELDALVLWHPAPFAVGADLRQIAEGCEAGEFDMLEHMLARFQQVSMTLRHAQIPVVAAVEGMALGGGCEFAMHADHRVLAFESYLGLVEAGVGLIPAGGGSKAFAMQADAMARQTVGGDVFPFIQKRFEAIARATVSKSALEAVELGFANASDDVLLHPGELLHVALSRARAIAEAGYCPPPGARDVVVAGRNGIATLEMMLVNMAEGGYISAHDYRVAKAAATALCGGEVDTGTAVSEGWLLEVERAQFMALLRTDETQERIRHMLDTGKPLRN